jgi:predicted choloylglycine hydrolase
MPRRLPGCASPRFLFALGLAALAAAPARADEVKTVARCGQGFLETVNGYRVLHVQGSPYEMGYQHGVLLKEHIRQNLHYLIHVKGEEARKKLLGGKLIDPRNVIRAIVQHQQKFIPREFLDELDGVADGAGAKRDEVRIANFIPELFHCSGFAVMNKATKDGTLYHGRVLDYAVDWQLQEHAVLVFAKPYKGVPFVNVTYAGFVGSVTGMNSAHISIGEMGGRGLGHWDGVPMALLVREVLQRAKTLDEAVAVFRDQPRTCQYFYVIADGNSNRAVGMEASWDKFFTIKPGVAHALLPDPVPDAVLLSAGDRYNELVRRVKTDWGKLDAASARKLMDCPVAMKSNLHDVLFAPASTKFWVANASKDKKPAATQPYQAFQLTELLRHRPDPSSPLTDCPKEGMKAAAHTQAASRP